MSSIFSVVYGSKNDKFPGGLAPIRAASVIPEISPYVEAALRDLQDAGERLIYCQSCHLMYLGGFT